MIRLQVPATSANLGCGFDTLGVAWNWFNTWEVERSEANRLIEDNVEYSDPENTLMWKAMRAAFDKAGIAPIPLSVAKDCAVPLSSGLGSSAAAIAGGLRAANWAMDNRLSTDELVDLAAALDGHPDNTTPALVGGLCVCIMQEGHVLYQKLHVHPDLTFAVATADFQLSTSVSRGILPDTYDRKTVVHDLSRAALMAQALEKGRCDLLCAAADDRIHQPYRRKIIEDYDAMESLAYESGAKAFCLSGAGPTLLMMGAKDASWIDRVGDVLPTLCPHRTLRRVTVYRG